jgi:hypothetical protein
MFILMGVRAAEVAVLAAVVVRMAVAMLVVALVV